MARCGIARIDDLLANSASVPAIGPGDSDREAVGLVQDLLRGHGFTRLPDCRGQAWGRFGDLTRQSVLAYRASAGLEQTPRVDTALLEHMIRRESPNPVAARGYVTLALGIEYTGLLDILSLTCLYESGGRFACLNRNTDRAGLSFGIIQWAQKPGRLHELLLAFQAAAAAELAGLAGGAAELDGLLNHTGQPGGGVDPGTGRTLDPRYDLVEEPWISRFRAMGRHRGLQKVQVETAIAAFQKSLENLRRDVPKISSQRGLAFLLDLANQHGDGGARSIYRSVVRPELSEQELLAAMERESVRRVAAQYGQNSDEAAATASRRRFFRTTRSLADTAADAGAIA